MKPGCQFVGGGPVGLTAAAQLVARNQPFIVLEAGAEAGAAVREWGHVRMFSPWRYMVDGPPGSCSRSSGWQAPTADELPTGQDLVDRYVTPLRASIRPSRRTCGSTRAWSPSAARTSTRCAPRAAMQQPFEIRLASGETIEARAVIDASGTWSRAESRRLGRNRGAG